MSWLYIFCVELDVKTIAIGNIHLQVQLVSRDEQSILIVTYAELKHCLEQAFSELTANAAAIP